MVAGPDRAPVARGPDPAVAEHLGQHALVGIEQPLPEQTEDRPGAFGEPLVAGRVGQLQRGFQQVHVRVLVADRIVFRGAPALTRPDHQQAIESPSRRMRLNQGVLVATSDPPGQRIEDEGHVVGVSGAVRNLAPPAQAADPGAVSAARAQQEAIAVLGRLKSGRPAHQAGLGEHIDLPRLHARALEIQPAVAALEVQALDRAPVHAIEPGLRPEGQGLVEDPGTDLVKTDRAGGHGRSLRRPAPRRQG